MQRAEKPSSPGGRGGITLVPPPASSHVCFVSLSIIPLVTAEPPNPALFPSGTPGSRASCAKGTSLHQQRRYCNGNNAVYSPINPGSFCASSPYVMLMLTRCAAQRDGPGSQRPANGLFYMFYTAPQPQPSLINPRDEPAALGSPAAAGRQRPSRLRPRSGRLGPARSGVPGRAHPRSPLSPAARGSWGC